MINTILGTTKAWIENSNVTAGSEVDVTAMMGATITATVESVSLSVAVGAGSTAGALGVAIAENFIGYTQAVVPVKQPDPVSANIDSTSAHTVKAGTKVSVGATDNSTIEATVAAASAAVEAGLG